MNQAQMGMAPVGAHLANESKGVEQSQLHAVRLALARNLARAHISESEG